MRRSRNLVFTFLALVFCAFCASTTCHFLQGGFVAHKYLARRYTGQDFDAEFIQVLQQACHKYIENEGVATLEEVADFVRTKVCPAQCNFLFA